MESPINLDYPYLERRVIKCQFHFKEVFWEAMSFFWGDAEGLGQNSKYSPKIECLVVMLIIHNNLKNFAKQHM